jgi:hypothetical protein
LNIYALSPNDIKQLLYFILTCNNNLERWSFCLITLKYI